MASRWAWLMPTGGKGHDCGNGGFILPQVAGHLVREVTQKAKKLGLTIKTSTRVEEASIEEGKVSLRVSSEKQGPETIVSDKVLVTIGRVPHTQGIGLDQAGIATDERGYILMDSKCRTNVEHIFAIGDITPGPALAHRASKQGVVAAEVIGGLPSAINSPNVPYVIFSDPQIARVWVHAGRSGATGISSESRDVPFPCQWTSAGYERNRRICRGDR
ncbi:FAD-dependent oxidoreductase [Ammoniphilus sp. 3BR4]|uniref:FAD-dependent oxidoreductase n=1 Tax=Ammoniphilus sp. 3BR4 TaxID=3158265 RepID=UPI003464F081